MLKELELGYIDYLFLDVVGSGSYGFCYRVRYRGINVVVKKMIYRDIERDKLRAKREVVYEVEVFIVFGDYEGLFMFIGIIIVNELFCFVI